jgi:hypothetical protein
MAKAHEKMLNIPVHQGSANQTTVKVFLAPVWIVTI